MASEGVDASPGFCGVMGVGTCIEDIGMPHRGLFPGLIAAGSACTRLVLGTAASGGLEPMQHQQHTCRVHVQAVSTYHDAAHNSSSSV